MARAARPMSWRASTVRSSASGSDSRLSIENQPAAAGTVAYTTGARAAPDGYTLVYGTSSIAVNAVLRAKPAYDPLADFQPISMLLAVQNVLIVPNALPAKSVAELIQLAKAQPGKLNYVSLGPGSTPHLSAELFRAAAGINVQQVSYADDPGLHRSDREPRAALDRLDAERVAAHPVGQAACAGSCRAQPFAGASRRADPD